jgi:hypothetical protein
MPQPDFQLEVITNGIVIRHNDGHVLSFYRPGEGSTGLNEHSRYCHPGGEASFARFIQEGSRAAYVAALQVGWLPPEVFSEAPMRGSFVRAMGR